HRHRRLLVDLLLAVRRQAGAAAVRLVPADAHAALRHRAPARDARARRRRRARAGPGGVARLHRRRAEGRLMPVPLKVNVRGLFCRRTATLLTVGGVGLIVMVFVVVWGMSEGLQKVFKVEADPANLLVVSQGSNSETTSGLAKEDLKIIAAMDG